MNVPSTGPLRILFVDYTIGFGGAVRGLALLQKGLEELGHETWIATSQTPSIVEGWYGGGRVRTFRTLMNYRTLQEARSTRRWVGRIMGGVDRMTEVWNRLKFRRMIREIRPHVVHLNAGFSPVEAARAAESLNTPWVVHSKGFPNPEGARRRPDPYGSGTAATFICMSEALARAVRARGAPPDRVHVIGDPVDPDRFSPTPSDRASVRGELGLSDSAILAALFGRVTPWKGHLECLEAIVPLMDRYPDLHLAFVGDHGGEPADLKHMQRIRRRVDELGRDGKRIHLMGYRDDVEACYAATDIVLHTSVTPEPFGRVLIEGMMAARPVIAADQGGPLEILTHGVDGLLADPRDPRAFGSAVETLVRDSGERRRLGDAARATAELRFHYLAIAREVEAVYRAMPR